MKTFVIEQGLGPHVGVFFGVSMSVMIIFRMGLGRWLDAVGKTGTLSVLSLILSVFYMMLPRIDSLQKMIVSAVGYGVIMGCMLPLLNGLMFENSSRQFRGINSNLMFFMMDAGFFLCPMLMGGVLASGGTYTLLFTICAVISLVVVILTACLGWWRSMHDDPNTGDNTD
jgi:MFS family permease